MVSKIRNVKHKRVYKQDNNAKATANISITSQKEETPIVAKDMRPWVEKYRPSKIEDIVLDDMTKIILDKILSSNKFPNLLLYGPPGTGKTTTVINLVNEYRRKMGELGPGLVIHLNASDERGVDIVRGTLQQFVKSSNMFIKGTKFVILDEADYMTTQAQTALRQLIQTHPHIKFCLICNYVSKVDTSLRNEFVRLRFNHLPSDLICKFLFDISENENICLTTENIEDIRNMFGSDMRSMINFIQTTYANANSSCSTTISSQNVYDKLCIIRSSELQLLFDKCLSLNNCMQIGNISERQTRKKVKQISDMLIDYCNRGFGIKNIITEFLNFIIVKHPGNINSNILSKVEFIVYHTSNDTHLIIDYFIKECIPEL